MTGLGWAAFAVVELALAAGIVKARSLWRNETDTFDTIPLRLTRAFPVTMVWGFVWVPTIVPVVALDPEKDTAAAGIALVICLAVMIAGLGLTWRVRYSGRPIGLVPPHLRDLPDGNPKRARRRKPSRRRA
jgi:hypothetical protein